MRRIARKLLDRLGEPFRLNGPAGLPVQHDCTASVGAVMFDDGDVDVDALMSWADGAMYRAKQAGGDRLLPERNRQGDFFVSGGGDARGPIQQQRHQVRTRLGRAHGQAATRQGGSTGFSHGNSSASVTDPRLAGRRSGPRYHRPRYARIHDPAATGAGLEGKDERWTRSRKPMPSGGRNCLTSPTR